jgi:hydroxyacylglutathione hydrolase
MMIHCHFAVVGLSNSYLIGPKGGGDAMLIDPSRFDIPLLNMIEDNHYYIRWVLVTHNHENHIRGLKTLLKIYDAKVYGAADEISGVPTQRLHDSQPLELPNVTVMPLEIFRLPCL